MSVSSAHVAPYLDQFRRAIEQAGLTPPPFLRPGGIVRFHGAGKSNGNKAGWAWVADDEQAGAFGDWSTGLSETWHAERATPMSATEQAAYKRRMAELHRVRREEQARAHAGAAEQARQIWEAAQPAPPDHPYLQRKGVGAYGLRLGPDGRLIAPIYNGGTLASLQFIDMNGNKEFLRGGAKKGGSFVIGGPRQAKTLLLAEGYATAASLHEATNLPVAIGFDAGNLLPVAQSLRGTYPDAQLIICGDNDASGVGQEKAQEAVRPIGGLVAIPKETGMDWNDVAKREGHDFVRREITAVLDSPSHILDEVHHFLGRFVAYPSDHAHVAHTLWIAHAHLMDCWESTPRLAFLSPEPGSGKTRALEVTETLVPRPVEAVNATSAYLFRKVSDPAGLPTILFDEIDTIFGPKAKDHEEIRGILNAGHRRGAVAGRCVVRGKTVDTEELPAFCAVAVAGLGNLPDTILTRSVILRMRRRAPSEQVEPYRRRLHAPEGNRLRERLVAWAATLHRPLPYPNMPEGVTDRPADVWEALLSVADIVGGEWPNRARVAAVALVADAMGDRGSLGVRLLADLRTIFGESPAMATATILKALIELDEAPWGDLKGKPIDSRKLANFLRPYEVTSKNVRVGTDIVKGYAADDLFDPWQRYLNSDRTASLPPSPNGAATSATPATGIETSEPDAMESPDLFIEDDNAA